MKNAKLILFAVLALFLGSCTEPSNMTEVIDHTQRNKDAIIKANDELFNKGNLAQADSTFTANYAGEGPEWIKTFVGNMRTAFPDIQVTVDPLIGEKNKTGWVRTHTGTHTGAFLGFEPTNKKLTWTSIIISEYNEEGKVTKEWGVNDLFEVLYNASLEEKETGDAASGDTEG